MPNLNKVILIGNLTRDVEVRSLPKGTSVGDFSLAINRKWKTDDGEEKEEVCFVECTTFGKSADTLAEYVKKGDPLCVTGRLKMDSWEDKETEKKRSKLKVIVEEFQFLGTKGGKREEEPRKSSKPASKSKPEPQEDDDDSDNVPF